MLKDHRCDECIRVTLLSHHNKVCDAIRRQSGVELQTVDIQEGIDYSFKPAQVVLLKSVGAEIYYNEMNSGLAQMNMLHLI